MELYHVLLRLGALFVFLLVSTITVHAHEVLLDRHGCHYDMEQGGYHCHRGQFAGKTFTTKTGMYKELRKSKKPGFVQKKPQQSQGDSDR